jgi:carbamoyltransferase
MRVLGLSFDYHDAAAVLLQDGQILAASAEERFTRKKHTSEFPQQAIAFALQRAGLSIDDVDHVVFYEKPLRKFDRVLSTALAGWPRTLPFFVKSIPVWLGRRLHVRRTIQKALGSKRDILFSSHHLSHAASAFLLSPFEEAAILSVDGVGEWATTTWGQGRGLHFEVPEEIRFPHSLGLYYSALTSYLGFKVNDAEWKVMGLAPYGEPRFANEFRQLLRTHEDGSFALDMRYFAHVGSTKSMINSRYEKLFGRSRRQPEASLDDFHHDIARSGQLVLEEAMLNLARAIRKRTGKNCLAIGGGVGLNSVANWRIYREAGFDEVFIQPAAGDDGGALGAAALVMANLGGVRTAPMRHAHLGPEFSSAEIGAAIAARGLEAREHTPTELVRLVAARLHAGDIVGWFQGRAEFGPRALGARSILATPTDASMKDRINARVKYREAFRPFAPSVPHECAHQFFEVPAGLEAPFMLLVPPVRAEYRTKLPAITHADGSARIQTVRHDVHPLYHQLLSAFGALSGMPVLLNTSFNVRGEPIVNTPAEALATFERTGLDALAIGPWLVSAKQGPVDHERGMRESVALESDS